MLVRSDICLYLVGSFVLVTRMAGLSVAKGVRGYFFVYGWWEDAAVPENRAETSSTSRDDGDGKELHLEEQAVLLNWSINRVEGASKTALHYFYKYTQDIRY